MWPLVSTPALAPPAAFQSPLVLTHSVVQPAAKTTAVGDNALFSVTTGVLNTALGDLAGSDIVAGNNINVIGAFQSGISTTNGEVDNSTYISNIIGAGVDAGTSQFVFVDQDGKLGTTALQ